MGFKKTRIRKVSAAALAVLTTVVSVPFTASMSAGALVTDPAGDYDNFAKALQYSLHFYDANMCGPEVEEHSRFKWRANCHVYDGVMGLSLVPRCLYRVRTAGTCRNDHPPFLRLLYALHLPR